MGCDAVADEAGVGLDLAEHESLPTATRVHIDLAVDQRNLDLQRMHAGLDALDFHGARLC
jgi:hypothetical protein